MESTLVPIAAASAAWVSTLYTVYSFRRGKSQEEKEELSKMIAAAIEIALSRFRTDMVRDINDGFQSINECLHMHEKQDSRINSVSTQTLAALKSLEHRTTALEQEQKEYVHKWKHRVVSVLHSILMFLSSEFKGSPLSPVLEDAASSLKKD